MITQFNNGFRWSFMSEITHVRLVSGIVVLAAMLVFSGQGSMAQDITPTNCAADGRLYDPGDVACIPACHGQQRLAKCERTDSGVGWTPISESCPNAMNFTPYRSVNSTSANTRLLSSIGGPSLLR